MVAPPTCTASSGSASRPTIAERASEASTSAEEHFKFQLEDTQEGCYRDICAYLMEMGWKRMPIKKKSKLDKKLPSRKDDAPLLYWVLNEKDVDFASLAPHQVCNHFEGLGRTLTTKSGFCDLLREMDWMCVDGHSISPRGYNLGDPVQREEFVEDFKVSAASNILKWILMTENQNLDELTTLQGSGLASGPIRNAMKVCHRYLRIKKGGEWPGVDRGFRWPEGTSGNFGLTDTEWGQLLETSYSVSSNSFHWHPKMLEAMKSEMILRNAGNGPLFNMRTKIWLLLQALSSVHSQMIIDGTKNIWIIKAPEACKGVGIKLLYKLNDILDCEKGMGGRTAQKYVENPLLAPCHIRELNEEISPRTPAPLSRSVKFDLRIWVLVTSVTPLRAKVYSRVYGRRCCVPYSDNLSTINDTSMHLTNFAIQRNYTQNGMFVSAGGVSALNVPEPGGSGLSATNRLRTNSSSCSRGSGGSGSATDTSSRVDLGKEREGAMSKVDLLLTQEEIIQIITELSDSLTTTENKKKTWEGFLWPKIKHNIIQTLQAVCCSGNVTQRDRSFELLGFDVMLDGDLNPWILEVNMSPALAHRETRHNDIIAHMATGIVNSAILVHTGRPQLLQPLVYRAFDGGSNHHVMSENETSPSSVAECDHVDRGHWEDLLITDPSCSLPPYLVRNIVSESVTDKNTNRQTRPGKS